MYSTQLSVYTHQILTYYSMYGIVLLYIIDDCHQGQDLHIIWVEWEIEYFGELIK